VTNDPAIVACKNKLIENLVTTRSRGFGLIINSLDFLINYIGLANMALFVSSQACQEEAFPQFMLQLIDYLKVYTLPSQEF
jgi:hypothetical protein